MKILIVDDNKTILEGISRILEGSGYAVKTADHCATGFEVAVTEYPDVIITDYEMPDGNGIELIRELHESSLLPHTRYILTSGRTENELAEKLEEVKACNFSGFLCKPFMFNELHSLLLSTQLA